MRLLSLLALPMFLAACGPNLEASCEDYIAAVVGCITEAYPDDAETYTAAFDGTCEAYDGVSGSEAKTAADLLDCYTAAYAGADCSTPEGYAAIDITGCAGA